MSNLATVTNNVGTLKGLIERSKGSIAAMLPKHLTPERLTKVALLAVSRDPQLAECTPTSLLMSVMRAAEMGLEPNSPLGHSYLVSYYNSRIGKRECQLIPGYRGLVHLAQQSGEVKKIAARVVYAEDTFELSYGIDERLVHVPAIDKADRGSMRGVYGIAWLASGETAIEWMSLAEVNAIRSRSASGGGGPWKTDFAEMARKTVLRRICKVLPLSTENAARLGAALDAQVAAESGEFATIDPNIAAEIAGDIASGEEGKAAPPDAEEGAPVISTAPPVETAPAPAVVETKPTETKPKGAKKPKDVPPPPVVPAPPPAVVEAPTPAPEPDLPAADREYMRQLYDRLEALLVGPLPSPARLEAINRFRLPYRRFKHEGANAYGCVTEAREASDAAAEAADQHEAEMRTPPAEPRANPEREEPATQDAPPPDDLDFATDEPKAPAPVVETPTQRLKKQLDQLADVAAFDAWRKAIASQADWQALDTAERKIVIGHFNAGRSAKQAK